MQGKKVLLVDDDPDMVFIARELLRSVGLEVFSASDAIQALAFLKSTTPDLVISDLMLPGMDGGQFCKRAKQDPKTAGIPFLMLTAADTDDAAPLARECGADAFLSKPFAHKAFLAAVQNLLSQKPS